MLRSSIAYTGIGALVGLAVLSAGVLLLLLAQLGMRKRKEMACRGYGNEK